MGAVREVPYGAVIDDVSAAVRAEPDIGRAVEPVDVGHECLVTGAVAGKVLKLQSEGRARQLIEVDQFDLVSYFGCRVRGIRCFPGISRSRNAW